VGSRVHAFIEKAGLESGKVVIRIAEMCGSYADAMCQWID